MTSLSENPRNLKLDLFKLKFVKFYEDVGKHVSLGNFTTFWHEEN